MHLIITYLLLFLGIFLEGEFILLSAIIAAHQGILNIWFVLPIAMISTIISDIIYFNLGKHKAKKWILNSKYAAKFEVVQQRLTKNKTKMLLSYRFLYGMRVITPIVLGTQGLPFKQFIKYSIITTFLWAFIITVLGYLFGEVIVNNLKHIQQIEYYFIGGLVFLGVLFMIYKFKTKKEL